MASSSKKRTTMAKLARENKLRERRLEKEARKDARRHADAAPGAASAWEAPTRPDEDPAAAPEAGLRET
jgi:hypothetical protein